MIPSRRPKMWSPAIVVLGLGTFICVGCGAGRKENEARVAACQSITAGMTEEEVLRRMGGQHKRIDLSGEQAGKHKLIFEGPQSASANPQVVVDSATNKVETVFCGE